MFIKKSILLIFYILSAASGYGQSRDYVLIREKFDHPVTTINISPDGTKLLTGFEDGSFSILDAETLEVLTHVEGAHSKAIYALEYDPKMKFILSAGHHSIKIWTPEGEHFANWKSHTTTIWNVDISSDGKYAVSSEFNKTFRLWDVYSGEILELMRSHEDVTMAVTISPDSRYVASGSNDLTVKIWDIESRKPIKTLQGATQDIYDVKFSPDGKLIAVASKDQNVRIYDLEEEKMIHLLKGHSDFVMEIEFSPDGRYLISASADQLVSLWEVSTGVKIYSYIENEAALLDIAYHPDGNSIYGTSIDNYVTRWAVDPEIFVLKYYYDPYMEEIFSNHLFDERRKKESKKDYLSRMVRADKKRAEIVNQYYQQYLERFVE